MAIYLLIIVCFGVTYLLGRLVSWLILTHNTTRIMSNRSEYKAQIFRYVMWKDITKERFKTSEEAEKSATDYIEENNKHIWRKVE